MKPCLNRRNLAAWKADGDSYCGRAERRPTHTVHPRSVSRCARTRSTIPPGHLSSPQLFSELHHAKEDLCLLLFPSLFLLYLLIIVTCQTRCCHTGDKEVKDSLYSPATCERGRKVPGYNAVLNSLIFPSSIFLCLPVIQFSMSFFFFQKSI